MTEQWTLPNGLRVVAEPLPYLRSVSLGIWCHVGSMAETEDENGLSHFIEHMVFKGTQSRSSRMIAEETDIMGGQLNAFTARDCTCFYARVIDEDLPRAVDLLSDLVLHPAMDAAELEKERGVVLEEIAMDEDDPEDLAGELLTRAQYGDTPAGRPIIGTAARVAAYTREDLLAYRQRHYTPANTVVALSGRYDRKRVEELVERFMGAWENAEQPAAIAPQSARLGIRELRGKDTEQLHLCLGYPGYTYGDPRSTALTILSTVYGGAVSSRLFQRIREDLGMAYSVYSYPGAQEGVGNFTVYAGVSPKNGRKVLAEIEKERKKLLRDGLTEKEFTEAKNQLRVGFLMGLESSGSRMNALGRRLLILGRTRSPEEVLQDIDRTTRDDVMAVAAEVLGAQPCLSAVGRGAEKYAEVAL